MQLQTRKVLDRSFTGLSVFAIALVAAALVVLLAPIAVRGSGAFVFRGTVEHRRLMLERFGRGDRAAVRQEVTEYVAARNALLERVAAYEREHLSRNAAYWSLPPAERRQRDELRGKVVEFTRALHDLLGPYRDLKFYLHDLLPPEERRSAAQAAEWQAIRGQDTQPQVPRDQYGQTRWDRARVKLHEVVYRACWESPGGAGDTSQMLQRVDRRRAEVDFAGTPLAGLVQEVERDAERLLRPRLTLYWQFLIDPDIDSHIFGGIWGEVLGTLYLTIGAILFAVPMGIISAIYLVEYAPDAWWIGLLRSCISTLAGVPSIVFGLFGLAFFVNSIHVSEWFMPPGATEAPSKSILAGALTLALLILPVIIRASEEAIRAVPVTYKEAALSVGAGKWRTVVTVILPAALPGILTGIVISMGRAAGETAPIIFTAAVSLGPALHAWETLTQPSPALPWNVYTLCTEHQRADEIRHVQYGMVLTLVLLVLLLNGAAIIMRARISRKLTG